MALKQEIYNHYLQLINDKISMHKQVLASLKESSSNETKSTAGDKHETALAMLQIEQRNTLTQLNDAIAKKQILDKINPAITPSAIVIGSLIKTNRGYIFMSVALGKTVICNEKVTALSPQSPLGMQLMGLAVAGIAEFNHTKYIIEKIE